MRNSTHTHQMVGRYLLQLILLKSTYSYSPVVYPMPTNTPSPGPLLMAIPNVISPSRVSQLFANKKREIICKLCSRERTMSANDCSPEKGLYNYLLIVCLLANHVHGLFATQS